MTDHADDSNKQEQQPKRRSLWFWLLLVLAIVILLPIFLFAILLLALRSETGTAWVFDQIPGLEVTGGHGSLLGQWQAKAVNWQGYGVSVDIQAPVIDWSPTCIFNKELCLDTLHTESLNVTVQPSSDEAGSEQGIVLPTIQLPLGLRIGDVGLGPFVYNGSRVWDRLELVGEGSGADWQLTRAFYKLDDYTLTVSGRVTTRRDWPVDLNVKVSLPPPSGDQWLLDINLGGSVRDLRLTGHSQGYLNANLSGKTAPLDPALPARLKISSEQFLALDSLPETLLLQNWFLEADGSLKTGFKTHGRATLPGTEGPIDLALDGHVDTGGARDIELLLTTGVPEQPGTARATGKVSWQNGFSADTEVSLHEFPWYSLIPDFDKLPVTLNTLEGSVSWADGGYHASLTAETTSPQGQATVSSEVSGDLDEIRLTNLAVVTGAGTLAGDGSLNFSGPLAWHAALTLDDFNPGYWLPLLEASLSGDVTTQGVLRENALPDMRAHWDLTGQWQSKPASARGDIDTGSGAWKVSGLTVTVGENTLKGNGTWGDRLAGQFALSLPAPADFLNGLGGHLEARLTASGSPDEPQGELVINARELKWQNSVALESLNANATLHPGLSLDSRITAKGISASGQKLDLVTVNLAGTRENHHLTLTAANQDADLKLTFDGGFREAWNAWQGALSTGLVNLTEQEQTWQLSSPADIDYQADGKLTFAAHCWRWQVSSLCAEDQTLLPSPVIAYRIHSFPTAAFESLMPETLRWSSHLDGSVDIAITDAGPKGQIKMDAGRGNFRVLTDGEWESFDYETFTASLSLEPDSVDMSIQLSGTGLGELSVTATVDPDSPDKTIEGQFNLQKLDIAVLGVFSGFETIAGEVNGQGKLSGPLMKPAVTGNIALSNGTLIDQRLPIPMEDVSLNVDLNGHSADISGRIRSNARSETTLEGMVNWEGSPAGTLAISGTRVPFNLEPYAHLELIPDLTIAFQDGDLSVSGHVAVPKGSIKIKGLPPQAVSVSEDEVVVGVDKEEPAIRSLNMDVTVVVGEDQVTFKAFGVEGDLEGTLRIGNRMDTRGTLQLVNGKYEAYGQELELRRARLLFVGDLTQPYLDIEAIRTVDTVVAGIRLTGPVQSPVTEVFSSPDMQESDALSYVILGRPPQSRGDEGQMSRAALSLGLTQASKVTGQLGKEFGIQNLILEAEGSGDQTSVVASGYLTDELSVRYGVGIFEPITTVALRYDLGRYFYLEAASGLASSLDIFYTRSF
ncbi:MAG TPA: translocation/assembly module TamB domain-containing protein [Marinobacter sp.]|nr:translocation/assembly module TamB domain-containing protein [Marinobacter sp.]